MLAAIKILNGWLSRIYGAVIGILVYNVVVLMQLLYAQKKNPSRCY